MLGKIKYIIAVLRLVSVLSLPTDSEKPQLKIIGGNAVSNRSDFPYQVSLRYMGFHFCGGAILDYNYVITAAHCCFDGDNNKLKKNYLKVVAGNLSIKQRLKDTTVRNVEEVYVHSEYDSESILNDIALWKISSPFIWTEQIQPISIGSRKTDSKSHCYVSGWGVTDYQKKIAKENLQYVELPLVSKKACKRIYPEIDSLKAFCAGAPGKDSCQGDSGGPLVCDGNLTGIVSYGMNCGVYPGVYTDVYEYKSWIQKKIGTSSCTKSSRNNEIVIGFGVLVLICLFVFLLI